MKTLTLICDNRPYKEGLIPSWGLSVGLKDKDGWTLFDLGNSPDIFLHNFQSLGGDLREVNRIVFSHLHHDHTGGLGAFRDIGRPIELYLPEPIPDRESENLKAWGFEVKFVDPPGVNIDDLWILPILHGSPAEQLLIMETGRGMVMLTGCAHFGIENGLIEVWERFKRPFGLICGGFHLAFRSKIELNQVLGKFKTLPVDRIAPCHCTGDRAIEAFSRTFPDKFLRVGTGWSYLLEV